MRWVKLRRVVADLVRVNSRYLVDADQRSRMRSVLRQNGFTPQQRRFVDAEFAAAPRNAHPYADLVTTSLTLAGIRISDDASPCLNLLIGEVREGGVFAGIHTALTVAKGMAAQLALPLRVVMLDFTSVDNDRESAERYIRETFDFADVTVVPRETLRDTTFGTQDVWLASHWKTAHAVQVACDIELIDRSRVAYLIQDYEPGFSPWSTDSVLASSTYHAGFAPIVNSTPLWKYLCHQENLEIDRSHVFSPSFEDAKLRQTAAARRRSDAVTVLFYGRPSKHRNLYRLGIAALKATALTLGDDAPLVHFYSAGEPHEEVDLGGGHRLRGLGRLGWDDYFMFLARTDVVLSLQQSPHPSHPPFDAAISGAFAVTNDFAGTRQELHPSIAAVPATAPALADALSVAIRQSRGPGAGAYTPIESELLGQPLDQVIDVVVRFFASTPSQAE